MNVKYHEHVLRHEARTADGKTVELLERRTFERTIEPDGSLSEAREVNRRFDLSTGERVNHISGDDYVQCYSGEALRVTAAQSA
jgi:hypothetical protein